LVLFLLAHPRNLKIELSFQTSRRRALSVMRAIVVSGSSVSHLSLSNIRIVVPTPPAAFMIRRQSMSEPELSSPYAGDVYTVLTKSSTNPFDSNLPQTQEEMWRFEKDWTTWNGSGIAPGRRIGSMNSQRREASFISVGDDEEMKASGKSMPNLLTSQQ
jgi:hypothetical protein